MEGTHVVKRNKKEIIKDTFTFVRNHTERICKPLKTEDYVVQPIIDVSPPKWHLAHSTWFFEEFVLAKNPNYKRFHPDFAYLFNSYYENVGEKVLRANRGNMTRPTVDKIYEYRAYVNEKMLHFFNDNINNEILDIIEIGINHEQQHQELLLSDIKYILGHNPLFPIYDNSIEEHMEQSESPKFIKIDEGTYEIGHKADTFCYDNELAIHKQYIANFEISHTLITNGEWMQFIEKKGYQNVNHWHAEGWDWVQNENITAPLYWHKKDDTWYHYTLQGFIPVDPNHILTHISYYEACAFAEWKGMRLPTEYEWEVASSHLNWGDRWEWTSSAYQPYPGFQKAEGALGEYNGKFMVNQMVLRGASIATPPGHSRYTYRNFFHPHLRWQFTGLRLVKK